MKEQIYKEIIRILNKEIEIAPIRFWYDEFGRDCSEESWYRSITIEHHKDNQIRITIEKRYGKPLKVVVRGIHFNQFSFEPTIEEITELNYILDKLKKISLETLLIELSTL